MNKIVFDTNNLFPKGFLWSAPCYRFKDKDDNTKVEYYMDKKVLYINKTDKVKRFMFLRNIQNPINNVNETYLVRIEDEEKIMLLMKDLGYKIKIPTVSDIKGFPYGYKENKI